jgi:16S rRNA C1402 N4-methylase RsmH
VGKLVRPDAAELERNPRARSARLRVAERTALVQAA